MFVDLHIHSCLSPCADDDMTPANICGMAKLKELDAIAVTDHNTARNLPFVKEAADYFGLILLPGMEITTREEVHLLGSRMRQGSSFPAICQGSRIARISSAINM